MDSLSADWLDYLKKIGQFEQAVKLTAYQTRRTASAIRETAYQTNVTADNVKKFLGNLSETKLRLIRGDDNNNGHRNQK